MAAETKTTTVPFSNFDRWSSDADTFVAFFGHLFKQVAYNTYLLTDEELETRLQIPDNFSLSSQQLSVHQHCISYLSGLPDETRLGILDEMRHLAVTQILQNLKTIYTELCASENSKIVSLFDSLYFLTSKQTNPTPHPSERFFKWEDETSWLKIQDQMYSEFNASTSQVMLEKTAVEDLNSFYKDLCNLQRLKNRQAIDAYPHEQQQIATLTQALTALEGHLAELEQNQGQELATLIAQNQEEVTRLKQQVKVQQRLVLDQQAQTRDLQIKHQEELDNFIQQQEAALDTLQEKQKEQSVLLSKKIKTLKQEIAQLKENAQAVEKSTALTLTEYQHAITQLTAKIEQLEQEKKLRTAATQEGNKELRRKNAERSEKLKVLEQELASLQAAATKESVAHSTAVDQKAEPDTRAALMVNKLTTEEAVEFVRANSSASEKEATILARNLGYLQPALTFAITCIANSPDHSVEKYLKEFALHKLKLEFSEEYETQEALITATAFSFTWDHLQKTDPIAINILTQCAYFDPQSDIPACSFTSALKKANEISACLQKYGLVTLTGNDSFKITPAIQKLIRQKLLTNDQSAPVKDMLTQFDGFFQKNKQQPEKICPHLENIALQHKALFKDSADLTYAFILLGQAYLFESPAKNAEKARQFLLEGLAILGSLKQENNILRKKMIALSQLCEAHKMLGDFDSAHHDLLEILALGKQIYGADAPHLVSILTNLAILNEDNLNQHQSALGYAQHAYRISKNPPSNANSPTIKTHIENLLTRFSKLELQGDTMDDDKKEEPEELTAHPAPENPTSLSGPNIDESELLACLNALKKNKEEKKDKKSYVALEILYAFAYIDPENEFSSKLFIATEGEKTENKLGHFYGKTVSQALKKLGPFKLLEGDKHHLIAIQQFVRKQFSLAPAEEEKKQMETVLEWLLKLITDDAGDDRNEEMTRPHLEGIVNLYRQARFTPNNEKLAEALYELGTSYFYSKNFQKADQYFREALPIFFEINKQENQPTINDIKTSLLEIKKKHKPEGAQATPAASSESSATSTLEVKADEVPPVPEDPHRRPALPPVASLNGLSFIGNTPSPNPRANHQYLSDNQTEGRKKAVGGKY